MFTFFQKPINLHLFFEKHKCSPFYFLRKNINIHLNFELCVYLWCKKKDEIGFNFRVHLNGRGMEESKVKLIESRLILSQIYSTPLLSPQFKQSVNCWTAHNLYTLLLFSLLNGIDIHTYIHIYWYIYIGKIKGGHKKE